MADGQNTPPLPTQQDVEIRPVEGFLGYAVGSDGSAWSCVPARTQRTFGAWRRLNPARPQGGYMQISMAVGGQKKKAAVHHLVLTAFVGPRPPGMVCRHLNGDPFDNRAANLRWGTPAENEADKIAHGTKAVGSRCGSTELTEGQVAEIKDRLRRGDQGRSLAAEYGVNESCISRIRVGKTWSHVVTANDLATKKGAEVRKFNSGLIDRDYTYQPIPGGGPALPHYRRVERRVIVCLCGSTRFWREFQKQSLAETLAGRIVLPIGSASGTDEDHFGNMPAEDRERVKVELDMLHFDKIELADEVLVLNLGGYVGHSTRNEVLFAASRGKPVRWSEPFAVPVDLAHIGNSLSDGPGVHRDRDNDPDAIGH